MVGYRHDLLREPLLVPQFRVETVEKNSYVQIAAVQGERSDVDKYLLDIQTKNPHKIYRARKVEVHA